MGGICHKVTLALRWASRGLVHAESAHHHKAPSKAQPTAYHQDQMNWPFDRPRHTLSAWIALQDTPVERGCMSFLTGSHEVEGLPSIRLTDQDGWKTENPDLEWCPQLTVPLPENTKSLR